MVSPGEGEFDGTPEWIKKVIEYSGNAQYQKSRSLAGTRVGLRKNARKGDFTGGIADFGYRQTYVSIDETTGKRHSHGPLMPDREPIPGLKYSPVEIVQIMFPD